MHVSMLEFLSICPPGDTFPNIIARTAILSHLRHYDSSFVRRGVMSTRITIDRLYNKYILQSGAFSVVESAEHGLRIMAPSIHNTSRFLMILNAR